MGMKGRRLDDQDRIESAHRRMRRASIPTASPNQLTDDRESVHGVNDRDAMPLLAPVMFPPPRAALRVIQPLGDDLRTIEARRQCLEVCAVAANFGEFPACSDFDELSACPDAEPVFSCVVRVPMIAAP